MIWCMIYPEIENQVTMKIKSIISYKEARHNTIIKHMHSDFKSIILKDATTEQLPSSN